ncbi:hypothetical protein [Arthrobacter sp. zg-Y1143]|uniref:hypothetical protein n=1 Tax=Arthrobacter sp. zg-Y1143 TaxID=3049065 RepID=UPI0024C40336|nr:hypothetical protein [Arthrobacter sp. zg-Y1143]MDK1328280.1 hypothetical protein [Arthrobacter sp. zg-Y1143]
MLYDPTPPRGPRRRRPQVPGQTPRSAWPVVVGAAILLGVAAFFGVMGLAVWILVAGFLLLLTGVYALALHRQSWAGLDTGRQRKAALAGSVVVLAVGTVATSMAAPSVGTERPAAALGVIAPLEPGPSPQRGGLLERAPSPQVDVDPPTPPRSKAARPPSPTAGQEASLMNRRCSPDGAARTQGRTAYRCTRDMAGKLVWMDRASAERITAARAATDRLNRQAAADRAETERLRAGLDADRQAAEQRAAAEKAAAEQAAEENARVAAERAEAHRQADAARRNAAREHTSQPVPTLPAAPPVPAEPVPTDPPTPPPPCPTPPVPTPTPTATPTATPTPTMVPVPVPTVPTPPSGTSPSVPSPSGPSPTGTPQSPTSGT